MGLMQVTRRPDGIPARRFSCSYDVQRLKNDMPYNLQVGAAELGGVMQDYRGNYILAFAAYNAGRGRVQEWIAQFGDPRDPKVDPVDWVERIPFMETRKLRAARDGEHAGLSRALRQRRAAHHRCRPATRRCGPIGRGLINRIALIWSLDVRYSSLHTKLTSSRRNELRRPPLRMRFINRSHKSMRIQPSIAWRAVPYNKPRERRATPIGARRIASLNGREFRSVKPNVIDHETERQCTWRDWPHGRPTRSVAAADADHGRGLHYIISHRPGYAVLPLHVHLDLGLSTFVVGLVSGSQFAASSFRGCGLAITRTERPKRASSPAF